MKTDTDINYTKLNLSLVLLYKYPYFILKIKKFTVTML